MGGRQFERLVEARSAFLAVHYIDVDTWGRTEMVEAVAVWLED
jgi:hypothetical protein